MAYLFLEATRQHKHQEIDLTANVFSHIGSVHGLLFWSREQLQSKNPTFSQPRPSTCPHVQIRLSLICDKKLGTF